MPFKPQTNTPMKPICAILFSLALLPLRAQDGIQRIPSSITQAVVYPSGALVTRTAKVNVEKGEITLVLSPVEARFNPQTLRVSGKGSASIRRFYESTNYLENNQAKDEIKALEDRKKQLALSVEDRGIVIQTLHDEENLLIKNQGLTGTNGLDVDALLEMSNLYRTRLGVIRQEKLRLQRLSNADQEEINRINAQLNQYRGVGQESVREIHVVVDASAAGTLSLEAEYYVYDASWTAEHELYAGQDAQVQLITRARIAQNTGMDWKNAAVTLSTAQASQSGNLPAFYPLVLQPQPMDVIVSGGKRRDNMPAAAESKKLKDGSMEDDDMAYQAAAQTEALTRVDFALPGKQTVPSGGKGMTVFLKEQALNARYRHMSYPRADPEVYLTARVYGWDPAGLLAGNAALYVDKGYVGTTYLNPAALGDTLVLSLGRDPGISIKHTANPENDGKSFSGKSVRKTRSYKVEVKNTRKAAVDIVITEQVPVSGNKDIEVVLKNSSHGEFAPKTGKLLWKLTLQPGETRTLEVEYAVTHPKDWVVQL